MKIQLIVPYSRELPPVPALGILYIAAVLRQNRRNCVQVVDARGERLSDPQIARRIRDFSPDIVGITGLSIEAPFIHRIAGLARENAPGAKVILGGPHANAYRDSVTSDTNIDFAVYGEGEETIVRLLDAISGNADVSEIPGIAFRKGERNIVNAPVTPLSSIDSLPMPAYDLIDMSRYFRGAHKHSQNPVSLSQRIIPVVSSRGCPYGCIYCHAIFGRKVRLRSVESVIGEIEFLMANYAPDEIEFADDIFNFDLARAKAICDEILRRKIKIRLSFPNGLRADRMDEELIVKLKQAGAYLIYYAVETASPELQKEAHRNLDLEKTRQVIEMTARLGIITGGYFILGFPGETIGQMRKTVDFALSSKLHLASFFYLTCFPNTDLARKMGHDAALQENYHHPDYLRLTHNFSAVPDREYRKIVLCAYRKFYLRVSQVRRILSVLPFRLVVIRGFIEFMRRCMIFAP